MAALIRVRDVLIFVGLMWGIFFLNWAFSGYLNTYGLIPRRIDGLPGIVLSPFLHANYVHLISNTVPLLVMGSFVALEGKWRFWIVAISIAIIGGVLVWLTGRGYNHIGASGVVYGLFAYVLGRAWWQRNFVSILLAIVVLALYSGIISTLFVFQSGISFEGHLFGFLSGGLVAYWSWGNKKSVKAG
ncbi:rhomboid family intramembrane serine protease [Kiloniella antarctica]|uniref:Rhomboid family intramembrane serine protease n=1 Tax=Kiloniella antarctica TaxID=1550907 RepID=A0ABW5BD90_9PROT